MDIILELVAPTPEVVVVSAVNPAPAIQLTVVSGVPGADGVGVIAGGTTGQVLAKASNTNYDMDWVDPGGGTVASVNGETGIVSLNQDDIPDGTTAKQYTATEETKLAGIATGATANDTDANLKNRANHTGTQAISTVTNLQTTLDGKAASSHTHAEADVTGLTAALAAKQPLDSDLTAIAGLSPTNDDILQRKAGAWANRTIAQLKTDLAIAQSDVSGLTALLALGFYYADGTTSTNPRPSVPGKVIWVGGTTQPVNMTTGDIWVKA